MTWPKYVLLAWFALSVLVSIASVGKKREPLSPGVAAGSTALTGALAALVLLA